jgi:O-succinylbenzoate synthase
VKLEVWRTRDRSVAFTARGPAAAERPALLLRLTNAGAQGLGEVAPLPELDGQTVETAVRGLQELAARGALPVPRSDEADTLRRSSPALVFGLELALASAHASAQGASLARALAAATNAPDGAEGTLRNTRLAGALSDPDLETLARRAPQEGFSAVKVKLGPADLPEAAARLVALRRWVGEGLDLRIDCNGTLTPRDVLALAPALLAARVTFLEEPCVFEHLDALAELPIPIFVDESLGRLGPAVLAHPLVRGAALKPTVLGGITRTLELAHDVRSRGLAFYVSHTFEGPVAMAGLAALALALAPGGMAQGLDASHLAPDAEQDIARELERPPDATLSLEAPAWTL